MQVWQLQEPFCNDYYPAELYFKFRRFIVGADKKKWFPWVMAAAQAAENNVDEWGLTWYLQSGIYTSTGLGMMHKW